LANQQELRQILVQGAQALVAGRREEARDLLLSYVEQDDKSEEAWLWLSGAVDDPDDIQVALENCLAINPDNANALQGVRWLEQNR